MSIQGYEIIQPTSRYEIERVGGRTYFFRDCWARDAAGDLVLVGIRDDLLEGQA